MKILFDQGVPLPFRTSLADHRVRTATQEGWDRLQNGALLDAAEAEGFDVFVTTDQNLRYQQDLSNRRIAIVVLKTPQWPALRLVAPSAADAIVCAPPGSYIEV